MSNENINIKNYLPKLILLENALGATTNYQMLVPFNFNSHNPIELQKVAKRIASFIGLEHYSFVVAIAKQKQNVGGHIELQNDGTDVFIEISNQTANFSSAVLATLAHELTHKYLHVHHISCGNPIENEYENEILTDIAAVYLGFGKLMLNGSECERKWEETTHKGTIKNTESITSGYLSLKQFAFIYYLVCKMRKIKKNECLSNLTENAERVVKECFSTYENFFKLEDNDLEESFRLKKLLENETQPTQKLLNDLENQISKIKQVLKSDFEEFLTNSQKQIAKSQRDTTKEIDNNIYNPCLKFLSSAKCEEDIKELNSKIREIKSKAERLNKNVSSIIHILDTNTRNDFDSLSQYSKNESFWNKMWSCNE